MDRTVNTTAGRVSVRDAGTGPVVLLVHGLLVDGDLWTATVAALGPDVRCVVPQLPLGAHREPADPRTTLTLEGVADLLAALLDAMDLQDVTVVANDTGGAISQLLVARHPGRVGRLVLTSCELFDNLPPRLLAPLVLAARSDLATRAWLRLVQTAPGRRGLMGLVARDYDDELARRWLAPAYRDGRIRDDLRRLMRSVRRDALAAVVPALRTWGGPVRLVWGGADRVLFPLRLASRYVAALPDARLEVVPGARALVPLDAPAAVATAVREYLLVRVG